MSTPSVQQFIDAALDHHRVGRFVEAEKIYRQILAANPNQPDALNLLGALCGQTGRTTDAIQLLSRACAICPNADAPFLHLGNVLREAQQPDRAIAAYERAIQINPASPEAHNNLGNALMDQRRHVEAIQAYRNALRANPRMDRACSNLGVALRATGQLTEALAALRKAVELDPGSSIAHDNLGITLKDLGDVEASIAEHRRAIQLQPNSAGAYSNLSCALKQQGKLEEAIAAARQAIALNPNDAAAYVNLGAAMADQGRDEEAIPHYRRALELAPASEGAWTNLGISLGDLGRFDEGVQACEKAVEAQPNDPIARLNLGVALLKMGDFERGWIEYEWRWKVPGLYRPFPAAQPLWDGQPFEGKTLFLHADQGLGDTLQFIRYVPLVLERGSRVLLGCDSPLRRLLQDIPGIERIYVEGEAAPAFDLHLPVVSLPAIFKTTLVTIPRNVPYLRAKPRMIDEWRQRLAVDGGRLKVGLVWAGRPSHPNDKNRSMHLAQLSALAADDITFYPMQKGPASSQAASPPPGMRLIDFTPDLYDLADSAALIANLDLVITVDTSIAHLAGGMGKPVWVFVPFNPDWRWLLDRDDSPWYPTMRLFRQPKPGNWDETIEQAANALREFPGQHDTPAKTT